MAVAWKAGVILGAGLVAAGLIAGYGHLDNFDFFLNGLLLGIVMSFVCMIGWARQLKGSARRWAAAIVFASPWIALALGYPIEGINAHGASALVIAFVAPPAVILGLILLIMSAGAR